MIDIRRAALLFLCLLMVATSGCSGPVPAPTPPERERALSWNRRGLAAETRGDKNGAVLAFEESLRVNRSIEDFDGVAISLLNLARVHRQKGELAIARERIDEALRILSPDNPVFPESSFEKARIELSLNNLPQAREWAQKAVPAEKKPYSGRMQNLLSRILFIEGKSGEALLLAETALESNRESANRAEEANSLRLIGDIALAGGDPQNAQARYLAALSIDKDLAESKKIAQDLRSLGQAAQALGDTQAAKAFFERADQVSQSSGGETEPEVKAPERDSVK